MERTLVDTTKGVSGISRPFKSILEQLNLDSDDMILYVGLPGVCTPFIELLSYAIRTLKIKQIFVPNCQPDRARNIVSVQDVGVQCGDTADTTKATVIVILGGLAMPISPVKQDEVLRFLERFLQPGGTVIGVSFMSMFDQAGWTSALPFDYVIDATIDPVKVESFAR
ncbi:MAG: DUF2124 family protein [Halobacteriota archaeon]